MSAEELQRFREIVASESDLASELRGQSPATFREAVVALARARGLEVSVADVETAERAGRRAWLERGLDP
jgi:EAL domain-containing protein (putative c-di-GMP-specific phosphodiesterase class I)